MSAQQELQVPGVAPAALLLAAALLIALGLAAHFGGLDTPWMLAAHARVPSRAGAIAWSSFTVIGIGWSALILVLAADRGGGRATALLATTFVLGSLFTHLPKYVLAVPRPAATALLPQLHIIGATFSGPVSMPSGHALTASATAALLWVALPRARRAAGVSALIALGALVGGSRVMVGAHWPSDVLVGAGLGLLAAALALQWASRGRGRALHARAAGAIRSRTGQRCIAALECASAAGVVAESRSYPDAAAMVVLLAAVAVSSAAWRWYALRHLQAPETCSTEAT